MIMGGLNEAAHVIAPLSGRVIVLTVTSASASRFAIPAAFAGMPCDFMMEGADAVIVFGDSSVAASLTAAATVTSENITIAATSGWRLQDGVSKYWVMPDAASATHFSVVAADAAMTLYIARSGGI